MRHEDPGLRFAPSGLRDLALPVGQNTPSIGRDRPLKIFHFTEIRNWRIVRPLRPEEEGRIAIVTNAGRAAVDADHIGAKSFAGRATVSDAFAQTTGATSVRQNRVVLTPGVCASSLAVMRAAQPGPRISHRQGDGGNSASLPGERTT